MALKITKENVAEIEEAYRKHQKVAARPYGQEIVTGTELETEMELAAVKRGKVEITVYPGGKAVRQIPQ